MKIIWLILLTTVSAISYSQESFEDNVYKGAMSSLFVNHRPGAKGEGMGRGLVANNEGDYGSYYNPALTSLSKGLNFTYSYSQNENPKPSQNYYGISYSNEKLGSFGISAYLFSKVSYYVDNKKSYYDAIYTLNYSKEVVENFSVGFNLNLNHYSDLVDTWFNGPRLIMDDPVSFDMGILKKFDIDLEKRQILQLGAALYNVTNSKVSNTYGGYTYKEPLPVIFRIGVSHDIKMRQSLQFNNSDLFSFFTHIEYQKFINSEYDAMFKIGEELSILEVVKLRAGYFYSRIQNADRPGGKNFNQSELTFGAGLNIPLNKIIKMKSPLNLKIDFASIEVPEFQNYFELNYYNNNNWKNNDWTLGVSLGYNL